MRVLLTPWSYYKCWEIMIFPLSAEIWSALTARPLLPIHKADYNQSSLCLKWMPGVSGKMAVLAGVGRVFHLLALLPLLSRKCDSQHFSLCQSGFGELQLGLLAYNPRTTHLSEEIRQPCSSLIQPKARIVLIQYTLIMFCKLFCSLCKQKL